MGIPFPSPQMHGKRANHVRGVGEEPCPKLHHGLSSTLAAFFPELHMLQDSDSPATTPRYTSYGKGNTHSQDSSGHEVDGCQTPVCADPAVLGSPVTIL